MSNKYFNFNGNIYYSDTIVKIKEEEIHNVGFCLMLKFVDHDTEHNLYNFVSLYDIWKRYSITEEQLKLYIESVEAPSHIEITANQIDPNYIDGMASAWVWYIIIMFFALALNGVGNKIGICLIASVVFWGWRYNKINGG